RRVPSSDVFLRSITSSSATPASPPVCPLALRAALPICPIAIVMLREHRVQLVNPTFVRMFGRTAEDVVGRTMEACFEDHAAYVRSEEHTSELQARENLVCRLRRDKKTIA